MPNNETCIECSYPLVTQMQLATALAAGRDVRGYAGRGLCRVCYNRARQPRTHRPTPKAPRQTLVVPDGPLADIRAAAITCAEQVPASDLRHVLEVLGIVGAAR